MHSIVHEMALGSCAVTQNERDQAMSQSAQGRCACEAAMGFVSVLAAEGIVLAEARVRWAVAFNQITGSTGEPLFCVCGKHFWCLAPSPCRI